MGGDVPGIGNGKKVRHVSGCRKKDQRHLVGGGSMDTETDRGKIVYIRRAKVGPPLGSVI